MATSKGYVDMEFRRDYTWRDVVEMTLLVLLVAACCVLCTCAKQWSKPAVESVEREYTEPNGTAERANYTGGRGVREFPDWIGEQR